MPPIATAQDNWLPRRSSRSLAWASAVASSDFVLAASVQASLPGAGSGFAFSREAQVRQWLLAPLAGRSQQGSAEAGSDVGEW
jgi:hypothetical protein